MKAGVIKEFRGEHFFLSNMYTSVFRWRNSQWFCAEQAFQYAKTFFPAYGQQMKCSDMAMRLRDTGNGATARKYGREIPIDVEQWDKYKVMYMREIVHAKFATAEGLVGPLINTGAMMLVEGNDWNDTFWGRCKNAEGRWVGLNTLGVILMEERGWWSRSDEGRP